ncbi:receptor-like protein kinase, partial [Trifolium pratense]
MSRPIPSWIGINLQILEVLLLDRNLFDEIIPTTLCQLKSLRILDLSENQLKGEIPRCVFPAMATDESIPVAIGKLVELQVLNLSRNQLVGSIPSNIGEMQSLEFLDLSMNHLSCAIPTSMANIDRLVMLDLSYNTLSGKIPIGTQLQSFDGSSFEGNPHLCGEQLDKACP